RLARRVGALLALTVGIVLVFGGEPERESSLDTRPSTLRSGPDGSKAVYDVLVRLGVSTERRRRPLFDLNRDPRHPPAVLAVLDPFLQLEAAELQQVARFVRAGGTVVSAGSGGGITRCAGWVTANAARLLRVDSFPVQPPAPGLDLPPVADYLRPPGVAGETDAARRMRGGDIEADGCETLTPIARDTLLRLRNGRPAALRLRYRGGGSIALVADVGAVAAGLEGAGGVDTAVGLTVSGLRRRLGRVGLLPAGAERAWLAALELALPTPTGRNAVRRLQRTINEPGGPERALAAAQAVEDVWEELRPRTTRAGL